MLCVTRGCATPGDPYSSWMELMIASVPLLRSMDEPDARPSSDRPSQRFEGLCVDLEPIKPLAAWLHLLLSIHVAIARLFTISLILCLLRR